MPGDEAAAYKLKWKKEVNRAGYQEQVKFTEKAAEAVSFFLTAELTGYTIVKEAKFGDKTDYWLGYDKKHKLYDPDNFLKAQMEVSGIFEETPVNTVEKRVMEKKQRIQSGGISKTPVYISVVEFSSPKAFFGKI